MRGWWGDGCVWDDWVWLCVGFLGKFIVFILECVYVFFEVCIFRIVL